MQLTVSPTRFLLEPETEHDRQFLQAMDDAIPGGRIIVIHPTGRELQYDFAKKQAVPKIAEGTYRTTPVFVLNAMTDLRSVQSEQIQKAHDLLTAAGIQEGGELATRVEQLVALAESERAERIRQSNLTLQDLEAVVERRTKPLREQLAAHSAELEAVNAPAAPHPKRTFKPISHEEQGEPICEFPGCLKESTVICACCCWFCDEHSAQHTHANGEWEGTAVDLKRWRVAAAPAQSEPAVTGMLDEIRGIVAKELVHVRAELAAERENVRVLREAITSTPAGAYSVAERIEHNWPHTQWPQLKAAIAATEPKEATD